MFGELLDIELVPSRLITVETMEDSEDIRITYIRTDTGTHKGQSHVMTYGFCKDAPKGFLQQFIDDLEERWT